MTEAKHTPAPWITQSDPCHYDTMSDVVSACGNLHASIGGKAKWQEQEANTRLIAAAADLLAALESLVPQLCEGVEDGCGKLSRHDCAACEGFAAIAKAKGQS